MSGGGVGAEQLRVERGGHPGRDGRSLCRNSAVGLSRRKVPCGATMPVNWTKNGIFYSVMVWRLTLSSSSPTIRPFHGSGEDTLKIALVESGRVRRCSKSYGSGWVGPGRAWSDRIGSGRIGSGLVGSGRLRRGFFFNLAGRVGSPWLDPQEARSNTTRGTPWKIYVWTSSQRRIILGDMGYEARGMPYRVAQVEHQPSMHSHRTEGLFSDRQQ